MFHISDATMNGAVSLTGVLATVGLIFKHGKREDLLEYGMCNSHFNPLNN